MVRQPGIATVLRAAAWLAVPVHTPVVLVKVVDISAYCCPPAVTDQLEAVSTATTGLLAPHWPALLVKGVGVPVQPFEANRFPASRLPLITACTDPACPAPNALDNGRHPPFVNATPVVVVAAPVQTPVVVVKRDAEAVNDCDGPQRRIASIGVAPFERVVHTPFVMVPGGAEAPAHVLLAAKNEKVAVFPLTETCTANPQER